MKIAARKQAVSALGAIAVFFAGLSISPAIAEQKVVRFALQQEPPQLNPMKATDTQSGFVIGHVMEGLTRLGKKNETQPGVAEKWKIDDKGATFWLRKDAKWSDGKPVTAKDFIYGWQHALDPKMASEYAFILFPIKNAEKINKGELPLKELGAVAEGDNVLKVTFEKPTGYFIGLTSFSTYGPVRQDIHEKFGDSYAADADKNIYNGPFILTKWTHGSNLTLTKNPHYWNAKDIKIDAIEIPYVTSDLGAIYNFFKDGKIDVVERMNRDDLPKAQADGFKVKTFSDASVFFLEYNFKKGNVMTNKNLRKAISLVFNRDEYLNKVVGIPGTKPGLGLIPLSAKGAKSKFRQEFPMKLVKSNVAEAKKLVAEAKKEMGGKIPPIAFLTQDTPLAGREAEYFQQLLRTQLGLELKIDRQIFKQRLAKMTSGDFDIVSAGWGPDFDDPMTYAELMASWNENNRGHWENAEYDKHIREAQATSDNAKRMKAMAEAEKITLEDEAILPLYERVQAYLVNEKRVDGVVRSPFSPDPNFVYSSVKP